MKRKEGIDVGMMVEMMHSEDDVGRIMEEYM